MVGVVSDILLISTRVPHCDVNCLLTIAKGELPLDSK